MSSNNDNASATVSAIQGSKRIRDAKLLLGIIAPAIHEAINELKIAARQIDECVSYELSADDLPEDVKQLAATLDELACHLGSHVSALRGVMNIMFEAETGEP